MNECSLPHRQLRKLFARNTKHGDSFTAAQAAQKDKEKEPL